MHRNYVLLSRENAAHTAQIRASIARGLTEGYDAAQPLPSRLVDLVKTIEQSSAEIARGGEKTRGAPATGD